MKIFSEFENNQPSCVFLYSMRKNMFLSFNPNRRNVIISLQSEIYNSIWISIWKKVKLKNLKVRTNADTYRSACCDKIDQTKELESVRPIIPRLQSSWRGVVNSSNIKRFIYDWKSNWWIKFVSVKPFTLRLQSSWRRTVMSSNILKINFTYLTLEFAHWLLFHSISLKTNIL